MRSDVYEGITKEVNKFLKKYPDYEVEMTESPTGNVYFLSSGRKMKRRHLRLDHISM